MNHYELQELIKSIKNLRDAASDEVAINSVYAYKSWAINIEYVSGDRIRYGEKLYRCVQAHTSQDGWEPNNVPALWTEVSLEEWPEWKRPTGAHDAYNLGAKVTHNGSHWISTINANIYEPGVYGWDEIISE